MKYSSVFKIAAIISLFAIAATSIGCDSYGGADVYLENVNIGSVSVDGKPVSGLPTQKLNILLKTGANKVMVSQTSGKTTIKLEPSGAVITSSTEGITFTGVDSSQIEFKWEDITTK
jgi:hypothetical protein